MHASLFLAFRKELCTKSISWTNSINKYINTASWRFATYLRPHISATEEPWAQFRSCCLVIDSKYNRSTQPLNWFITTFTNSLTRCYLLIKIYLIFTDLLIFCSTWFKFYWNWRKLFTFFWIFLPYFLHTFLLGFFMVENLKSNFDPLLLSRFCWNFTHN